MLRSIAHHIATVRMDSRMLFLEISRLVEQGKHEELLALGGRYAEFVDLQAARYR